MKKRMRNTEPVSKPITEPFSVDCEINSDEFAWVGQNKETDREMSRPSISFWQDAFSRLKKDKAAVFCTVVLLIIVVCAIVMPMISPLSMSEQHLKHANAGMFFKAEDHIHIFGTDNLGRDNWVRIWCGARISLFIAIAAVLINCVIGIIYGGISGYCGGVVDIIMMRIVELLNGIPYLLVVILLLVVLPRGIFTIILAMMMTGWTGMARQVRGQVMQLKQMEYVVAAKTMGASAGRIIFRYMVPNLISVVIVSLTLSIPSAIFAEAFLSFLGIGVPIPQASWGTLANDGIIVFMRFPLQLILPATFISITMLSFNILGDKLRDAFDPKLRR